MNVLTQTRLDLAEEIRAALGPGVPVYPAMPNAVSPPCVVLTWASMQPATFRGAWTGTIYAQILAGGGDNEATVAAMEDVLLVVADLLRGGWENPPEQVQVAGQTLLSITVVAQVETSTC